MNPRIMNEVGDILVISGCRGGALESDALQARSRQS